MRRGEPTYPEILNALSREYEGPITENELIERTLEIKSTTAKSARSQLKTMLRDHGLRHGWLRLPNGMFSPLHLTLVNLRFRLIPSPNEVAEQQLARSSLYPFQHVFEHELTIHFEGHDDLQYHTTQWKQNILLKDWMERVRFQSGDSILVTIQSYPPMVMLFEHEPAAAFQPARVQAQEQQLVECIVQQFASNPHEPIETYTIILPAYAEAAWRTDYPGRPWQQLLAEDGRIELLYDGLLLQFHDLSFYANMLPFMRDEMALLEQIATLQSELRAMRQTVIKRNHWDGIVPRVTANLLFETIDDTTPSVEPIDATQDYSALIDERAKDGYYDRMFVHGILDLDEFLEDDDDDDYELMDMMFDTIDLTLSYDYDLSESSASSMQDATGLKEQQRLIEVLGPERIARLEQAESESEALKLLITFINELMESDPSIFENLNISPHQAKQKLNGNGNGNGLRLRLPMDDSLLLNDGPLDYEYWLFDEDENEDEEIEDDLDDPIDVERNAQIMEAVNRSAELLQRFYEAQIAQGRTEQMAQERTRFVSQYASFLSTFYMQSLEKSSYATLDEYLFFVFPCQSRTPRLGDVRAMWLSLKQFYAFLRAEGLIASDAVIQELYRHRELAVRLVRLYDQLNRYSKSFRHLFARLFEPYTV